MVSSKTETGERERGEKKRRDEKEKGGGGRKKIRRKEKAEVESCLTTSAPSHSSMSSMTED